MTMQRRSLFGALLGFPAAAAAVIAARASPAAGYEIKTSPAPGTWISGANGTVIEGGKIRAANITAGALRIGANPCSLVGIEFTAERDDEGRLTGVFAWTGGYLLHTVPEEDGPVSTAIAASRVQIGNGYRYVTWARGAPNFSISSDVHMALNDPDVLLVATVSNLTGISLHVARQPVSGRVRELVSIAVTPKYPDVAYLAQPGDIEVRQAGRMLKRVSMPVAVWSVDGLLHYRPMPAHVAAYGARADGEITAHVTGDLAGEFEITVARTPLTV